MGLEIFGRVLGVGPFGPVLAPTGPGLAGLGLAALALEPVARLSLRVPGRERGRFPSNPGSSFIGR